MPIVEIRALPQPAGVELEAVLAAVTRELAVLLGEEPRGIWATWEEIEPGRYSEGGETRAEQPRSTHPPLVCVTAAAGRLPNVIAGMLETVAGTLARELLLEPGNVFVRYEEQVSGRLYTGGSVR